MHRPNSSHDEAAHTHRRPAWRPIALAAIGASALVVTGAGVLATLTATTSNVSPQSVDNGTLKLSLGDNGAGFSQSIANLAPGDAANRYIVLQNNGSLDGQALGFTASATGTASLISDGVAPITTKALRVGVTSCSVAWNPTAGTCAGTTTNLVSPLSLSSASQSQSLVAGAVSAGQSLNLRIQIALPDQDETTVNGVLPTHTVQGGAVNVTYAFSETQRAARTSNS